MAGLFSRKAITRVGAAAVAIAAATTLAFADFTNGGFETGDFTGWTISTGLNPGVTLGTPVESTNRAGLGITAGGVAATFVRTNPVTESQVDPQLTASASLRFPFYGHDTAVVNYTLPNSTNVNSLKQTMTIGTGDIDPYDSKAHVRFVVAPVFNLPAHNPDEQPYYFVNVRNTTSNTTLYSSFKYANQPGVPWKNGPGSYLYTDWQLVDVGPGPAQLNIGDNVEVEVIASRCSLGGHAGYVYVDGVGSFLPGISVVASAADSANSNSDLTYTYIYRNGAQTSVANAIISAVLPANTTFVSVTAPGATCTTPSIGGTGTVACNVGTLNKDALGTFKIVVHINNGATGNISHGNYKIDSDDTSALLGPLVLTTLTTGINYTNLKATITDGFAAVAWGQAVQLRLKVTNDGPTSVTGASVTYNVPAKLTGASWTCSGTGSATCPASGSGNINQAVTIPAGDSVEFLIAATVIAGSGSDSVINLATVTAPGGVTDSFSADNSGFDLDRIGTIATLSVTKNAADGGTVQSVPAAINCGAGCSLSSAGFLDGSNVTLSTAAAPNFTFLGWSGGGCAGTGTCTVTLAGNVSVAADYGCSLTGRYGPSCTAVCPGSGNCNGNGTCSSGPAGTGACTCMSGFAGTACLVDTDADGVPDVSDNCPAVPNTTQTDTDSDGQGDACDADDDNDTILDVNDNCSLVANPNQLDSNGDGQGDACESDSDGDGVDDGVDNCPAAANPDQLDTDGDGIGNVCDANDDNDAFPDASDNCPLVASSSQLDTDGDGAGDACDADDDNDGVADATDNCPLLANASQLDTDIDGVGDACDDDRDGDGIADVVEGSGDFDGDGIPNWLDLDSDADGILDSLEGVGDVDGDGHPNYLDRDSDGDGILDAIERAGDGGYTTPKGVDADHDGIDDAFDPDFGGLGGVAVDSDGDGKPDFIDTDADGDGILDSTEAFDRNGDGVADLRPSGIDANGDGVDDAFVNMKAPTDFKGGWRGSSGQQCSVEDIGRSLRAARAASDTLAKRADSFAAKARACGGRTDAGVKARRVHAALVRAMAGTFKSNNLVCPATVCTVTSTSKQMSNVAKLGDSLYNYARAAKLKAISNCGRKDDPNAPEDTRKNNADYRNELQRALKRLPKRTTRCP